MYFKIVTIFSTVRIQCSTKALSENVLKSHPSLVLTEFLK
jgi:hypothetical protein